jgi:hypothetical protein
MHSIETGIKLVQGWYICKLYANLYKADIYASCMQTCTRLYTRPKLVLFGSGSSVGSKSRLFKNQTWQVYMGQDLQPQDLTWVKALTQELDLTWEKLGLGRLGPKPGLGVLRPFLQFPRLRSRHGVGQNRTQLPNPTSFMKGIVPTIRPPIVYTQN